MVRSTSEGVQRQTGAKAWHALETKDVLSDLQVHEGGLSAAEAAARLQSHGPNQLSEAPGPGFLARLWDQLNNFVVWLLIAAAVISGLLGEWVDASAILAIVVLNTILGIVQEQRAEQALAALKKLAAPESQVLRDGHRSTIPASELVPGDIVFIEAGHYVPADLRLLEAVNLRVDESSITGESVPVQKTAARVLEERVPLGDQKNTLFMGTMVAYGRGKGVVTSTGMTTQLGLIATMLQHVEDEQTPLQSRLEELGKTLSVGALALVGLVFAVSLVNNTRIELLFGEPLNYLAQYRGEVVSVFLVAISLAIAAVPEGLPAVVTISLALGMREMIRRHALIRRLASVETLGSATTICSDKTGTLTQNEMTVTRLWSGGKLLEITGAGYDPVGQFLDAGSAVDLAGLSGPRTVLWLGALNNDAELERLPGEDGQSMRVIGDPTEGSLLVAAAKAGAYHVDLHKAYPRKSEVPFDSGRKRMITVHRIDDPRPEDISPFADQTSKGWHVIAIKGAPDIVQGLCKFTLDVDGKVVPLTAEGRSAIADANDGMTRDALRVLGMAYRLEKDVDHGVQPEASRLETDLIFAGMLGMIDPPREEVKVALAQARRAGIRTVMITGDYPNTARAIAESIGLLQPGHKVSTGADVDRMDDATLMAEIEQTDVFARVSPEHKMRIVDALQANDEVVAMTGDGVNDAPAIKRADIGVAMGVTGTDVAKGTADMVLTDDNYASIVSAVEQGRIIYANIRKFVFFLLSSNVAEIAIIFVATLAGLPTPLTAIQLLWLNLITDGAPALALATEKGDPDVMTRKPRSKREPIINRRMGLGIAIQTLAQAGVVLSAFMIGLLWHLRADSVVPAGATPLLFLLEYDWQGVDVQTAETMAFITLSMCELFRAYTVRSERASLFSIGVFSNRYMQLAVGASMVLLLLVCSVPALQQVFNTHFMSPREWAVVIGLSLIPAVVEEITKFGFRRSSI